MPGPNATLFNYETGAYEEVAPENVQAAIASGKYTGTGPTITRGAGDSTLVRSDTELAGAAGSGEVEARAAQAARDEQRRGDVRAQLLSDRGLSFSEGVVDALSVGLVHGTSEEDEIRRGADSGSALLGQLVGTAIGLKLPGPVSMLTKSGEALGSGVTRALLGEVENGFAKAAAAGVREASANAMLMAASAFGHQITDSVIADKPFAAEAIASEAGVGALMGFGVGFAGSAFGSLAKIARGSVEASGVNVAEARGALDQVNQLTRQWDDVVEKHAQRQGVLRVLAEDGHIPVDETGRSAAVREAQFAQKALRDIDPEKVFSGDAKTYQKWRDAVERYQNAVSALDDKMAPSFMERAHGGGGPIEPGAAGDIRMPEAAPSDIDAFEADRGYHTKMAEELDNAMAADPEARARYEEVHGKPWEPLVEKPSGGPLGEENLGGRASETSEQATNVNRRGGPQRVTSETPPQGGPGEGLVPQGGTAALGNDTEYDVRRFNKNRALQPEGKGPRDTVIEASSRPGAEGLDMATQVDHVTRHPVLNAGEAPADAAATAADFINTTGQRALPEPKYEVPIDPKQGKKAVQDYLNGWFRDFDSKPRVSIKDQLNARMSEVLDNISKAGGSRLDNAGALDLMKALKIKEAITPLGQRLDQIWSMGQAGRFVADEARGIKTPLRQGLAANLKRYAAGRAGRAIGAAALGGSIGGPVGAVVGMALGATRFAGKAASSAGSLLKLVGETGEKVLSGFSGKMVQRTLEGNRPYQYADGPAIKDPIERIQQLQRLAANPDVVRARVMKELGDMALVHQEMAQHIADTAVQQVVHIAASAPAIMLSPLGKAIKPSGTKMEKFLQFENAMHDLPGTLSAIASGKATKMQVMALQVGFPAVHAQLVRSITGDMPALQSLEEEKLKVIEKVLGFPLTRSSTDRTITARLQGNWHAPETPTPNAQAFKISAQKPTQAQSMTGAVAPGNERK